MPEQAIIVRRIYGEFLDGYSLQEIADGLMRDGIASVAVVYKPLKIRSFNVFSADAGVCINVHEFPIIVALDQLLKVFNWASRYISKKKTLTPCKKAVSLC